MADIAQIVDRLIGPLRSQVRSMVRIGRLSLVNENEPVQKGQALLPDGGVSDNVLRMQDYGFTSVPPVGAQALFLLAGQGTLTAIRADAPKGRPKGLPGESIMYTKFGHRFHMKADGSLEIEAPNGSKLTIKVDGAVEMFSASGVINVLGDLHVSGQVIDFLGSMATLRTIYNSHTHSENGVPGNPATGPADPQMS